MNTTKDLTKSIAFVLALAVTGLATQALADGTATLPQSTEACVPKACAKAAKPVARRAANSAAAKRSARAASAPPLALVVDRKPFEATAVDPAIALRDVPPKEIELPGVLRVDGESVTAFDPVRAHKITWANEGTQPIPISLTGPDHLILPFTDPYITGNDWVEIDKRPVSNNVYITFKFPDGVKPVPVTIYIESPTGGPSLGLQLMPKDIAPQTYTIVDEVSLTGNQANRGGAAPDYESRILDLMATVALRGTPAGYSVLPMKLPPVAFHGMRLDTVRRLSNVENDIFEYEITNASQKPVTIAEKDFAGARVQAVSIFPKSTLRAGERAQVFVIASKPGAK